MAHYQDGVYLEQADMAKPGNEPPLRRLSDQTDKLIAEAYNLTSDLERQLEGVLSPERPQVGIEGAPVVRQSAGGSPLAQRLEQFNGRLSELCQRLRHISSRVEV